MSRSGAAPRAAVSASGAPPRAAAPVSKARAEASRRNGARSRGPKTSEGKARSSLNALKHGLRAQKYVLLPQENAAEFEALETALLAELAPVGALQTVLARRVAVAAWRLARADRMEAEVLEFRSYEGANAGLALIRDGNATRSFEALLRYRGAAMAEFMRSLRTLKALQAEARASLEQTAGAALALEARGSRAIARRPRPDEPEPREASCDMKGWGAPDEPEPPRTLHETPARWTPNEPEPQRTPHQPRARSTPNRADAQATSNQPEHLRKSWRDGGWPAPNEPERRR